MTGAGARQNVRQPARSALPLLHLSVARRPRAPVLAVGGPIGQHSLPPAVQFEVGGAAATDAACGPPAP
eukprot:4571961-Prorocentrum_lima.AAC.1